MTAAERAEKIFGIASSFWKNSDGSIGKKVAILGITEQLEAYAKEREKELICEDCGYAGSSVMADHYEAKAEGRRAGLEKLLKSCDDLIDALITTEANEGEKK